MKEQKEELIFPVEEGEQESLLDKEAKLMEEWKATPPKPINMEAFDVPQHLIRMVARKISTSTILVSKGGLGKSYCTINTLKEEKADYVYLNTHMTPLALVIALHKHRHGKVIVLDDVGNLLTNNGCVSVLKGAMWEVNHKRIVTWETTSDKADGIPPQFGITSGIIILANKLQTKNPNVSALVSRANYYEIELTHAEVLQTMFLIMKEPYKNTTIQQRVMAMHIIKKHTSAATKQFNLRMLIKTYDYILYSMDEAEDLFRKTVVQDECFLAVQDILAQNLLGKQAEKEWNERTGKKRGMFYATKKAYLKLSSPVQCSGTMEV